MTKEFKQTHKNIVKNLNILQEVLVLLAGNVHYRIGSREDSKPNYKYLIPSYIDNNNNVGLTSTNVKAKKVEIGRTRSWFEVVDAKDKNKRYSGKTTSDNYLFLTSDKYLEDICEITSFLTSIRTEKIKGTNVRSGYRELYIRLYKKHSLQEFDNIKRTRSLVYKSDPKLKRFPGIEKVIENIVLNKEANLQDSSHTVGLKETYIYITKIPKLNGTKEIIK